MGGRAVGTLGRCGWPGILGVGLLGMGTERESGNFLMGKNLRGSKYCVGETWLPRRLLMAAVHSTSLGW